MSREDRIQEAHGAWWLCFVAWRIFPDAWFLTWILLYLAFATATVMFSSEEPDP